MNKNYIIIIVTIALFAMTACQVTPDQLIVVGKDQEKMIETAKGENSTLSIIQQVNAPGKFICNIQKNNFTIVADTPIFVPEANSAPIKTAKRGAFSC